MIRKHKKTIYQAFNKYLNDCIDTDDYKALYYFEKLLDNLKRYCTDKDSTLYKIVLEYEEAIKDYKYGK